jgi:PAS domain-containing protein
VIIWNKACEELTGITATELLGTTDSWKAFYRKERLVLAEVVLDGKIRDLPFNYRSYNKSSFAPGSY